MTEGHGDQHSLHKKSGITEALKHINLAVHATLDSEEIIERLLAEGSKALACDSSALSIRTDKGWKIRHVWGLPKDMVGKVMSDDEERHAVIALEQGEPVFISDAENDPRVNSAHLAEYGICAVLALPLIAGTIRRGVVFFNYNRERHDFDKHEDDFVRHLAITAAIALENSRNHHQHIMAENAMRASEKKLRKAMDAGRMFSFESNFDTGSISRSSNADDILGKGYAGDCGLSSEKYLQQIHPDDRAAWERITSNLNPENPSYRLEYRFMHADGSTIWMDENGNGIFDKHGKLLGLHGVSKDITDLVETRNREKAAIAASAAQTSAIETVDAMYEGVALLEPDGTVKSVNPAFAAFVGRDEEHLKGRNIRRILPNIFEGVPGKVSDALNGASLKKTDLNPNDALCIAGNDGTDQWVIPALTGFHSPGDGNVALVLTIRDVTQLVEVRESLRQSQNLYRELVENAQSLIIRVDNEHRIIFINEYARRFLGYTQDTIVGESELDKLLPADSSEREQYLADMDKLLSNPDYHSSFENRIAGRDGKIAWIYWTNKAIVDDDGHIRGVLRIGTDITERKMLEEQNERYRRRLQRLADMLSATEDQTRRKVSSHIHDTVVQSLSLANIHMGVLRDSILAEALSEPYEEIDNIRMRIEAAISECRGLMSDLTPPLLYEVGLATALKGFASRQAELNQIEIEVEAEGFSDTLCDSLKGMLFQSARELVMNAMKHADPSRVLIRLSSFDSRLALEVIDDGDGFDSDDTDLFDADDSGGFGLFNIRERVSSVGGGIELESTPKQGTKARIEVPV